MQKKEFYRHILPHFQQPGQAYFVTWNLKDAVPPKALIRYSSQLENLRSQLNCLTQPGMAPRCFGVDSANSGAASQWLGTEPPNSGATVSEPPNTNANHNSHHKQIDADMNPCPKDFVKPGSTTETERIKKEYYSIRKKYIKAYNDLLDAQKNPVIDLSRQEFIKAISDTLKFWEDKKLKNYAFCIMPNHVHWVFKLLEKDLDGNPVYLQDIMYSVKRFSASLINKLDNRKGTLWQKESFDTTLREEKHLYYAIKYTINNPVKAGLVNRWENWPGCWLAD